MKTRMFLLLLAICPLFCGSAYSDLSIHRLHAQLDGQMTGLSGTGQVTRAGLLEGNYSVEVAVIGVDPQTGKVLLNGDLLVATRQGVLALHGVWSYDLDTRAFQGPCQAAGGTGRFFGASGDLSWAGAVTPEGALSAALDGELLLDPGRN